MSECNVHSFLAQTTSEAASVNLTTSYQDVPPEEELLNLAGSRTLNKAKISVVLDDGAFMPRKAHEEDAGYDIFSPVACKVPAGGSAVIDTGVHTALPEGFAGLLVPKSGLNVKFGILSHGLIDAGYTGSIRVKLYNNSKEQYDVHRGDKVSQMMIIPIANSEMVLTDSLEETSRGTGGFGSTGR